jgi:hypothetical protein
VRERHQRPRVPDPSAPLAGTVGDFTALQLIRPILALRFHPVPSPPTLAFVPSVQTRHSRTSRKSVSRGGHISELHYGSLALQPADFVHPPDGGAGTAHVWKRTTTSMVRLALTLH